MQKSNRGLLFFLLGLGSAALVAGSFWIYQEQHAPAPPRAAALTVPPLPTGSHNARGIAASQRYP
jgi:hypothetical protein